MAKDLFYVFNDISTVDHLFLRDLKAHARIIYVGIVDGDSRHQRIVVFLPSEHLNLLVIFQNCCTYEMNLQIDAYIQYAFCHLF